MSMPLQCASLYFKAGSSDKEYHAQLEASGSGFVVNFQYGRRGGTLAAKTKTKGPLPQAEAQKVFDDLVASKMRDGYTPTLGGVLYATSNKQDEFTGYLPQLLNEVNKSLVPQLMTDDEWVAEQKYDGNRRMMDQATTQDTVSSINRKGLRVGLPQETADAMATLSAFAPWRVDGELVGSVYYVFDVLEWEGVDCRSETLERRLERLEVVRSSINHALIVVAEVARTTAEKTALRAKLQAEKREGMVYKKLTSLYVAGRPASGGEQLKDKFVETATFIVVAQNGNRRSVELGLFDVERSLGNVTIPPNADIPNVGDLVEVRYLYAYVNGALCQPCYIAVRDDIDNEACLEAQLKFKPVDLIEE